MGVPFLKLPKTKVVIENSMKKTPDPTGISNMKKSQRLYSTSPSRLKLTLQLFRPSRIDELVGQITHSDKSSVSLDILLVLLTTMKIRISPA